MLVFLLQDTLKKAPVGFERNRRNIFDPEDDPEDDDASEVSVGSESDEDQGTDKKLLAIPDDEHNSASSQRVQEVGGKNVHDREKSAKKECATCKRKECTKVARFDSLFCSDACGVSSLESDLLRTFFYSSDIHPSSLRH